MPCDAPLRIFMTADAVGGIWSYALDLSRGLAAEAAEVTLAILGPAPDAAQRAEAAAIRPLRLVPTGLPLEWTAPDAGSVLAAGRELAALAEAEGADVVHLNSPALAVGAGFAAPLVAACHSCVATWWEAVHGGALPPDFRWRRDLVAAGYRAADRLICPSAAFAAATAAADGLRQAPRVVHNGRARQAAVMPPAELPADCAFTAGRLWDEGKNLRALDDAAALLDAPIIAAGPLHGPNGARVALPHLRSLGPLGAAEVAACLAARPVFVSAARYEPFGLAVLEAAQAGCALVLSDIPSFREIWGDAADYVAEDTGPAYARAIGRLLRDPDLRRRRGAAARARAARYTVEAMVAGTLALYRELLAQPARRRIGL
jgi:glycosyltransferase involved in cell wall biosynthesis